MPTKKPKAKSYEDQRELWYKKLSKSGFNDIETNEFNLKSNSNIFTKKSKKYQNGGHDAKYEYFYMARQFLNDYEFESKRQEIIWEYHSEAISITDIRDTLQKAKVIPKTFDHNKVWAVIKELKKIMLEMYLVK